MKKSYLQFGARYIEVNDPSIIIFLIVTPGNTAFITVKVEKKMKKIKMMKVVAFKTLSSLFLCAL